MEALELFGVRANARTTAKTLKVQLVQLIQDQAPCSVVGDGMLVDSAPTHAPAAAAAIASGSKPSAVSEGLLARLAASGGAFKPTDDAGRERTLMTVSLAVIFNKLMSFTSLLKMMAVCRRLPLCLPVGATQRGAA